MIEAPQGKRAPTTERNVARGRDQAGAEIDPLDLRLGSSTTSAKERPERITGRAGVAGIGAELVQRVESVDGQKFASGPVQGLTVVWIGEGLVSGLKFTTVGLMGLAALFAVDFVVVPGITRVPYPLIRIGLFGALPMVHGLAFYLVLLGVQLWRRGEVGLPSGVFLLAGGVGVLVHGLIASGAPQVLMHYVDNAAGLWTTPGQSGANIYTFGMNEIDPPLALLVFATITPLLVIPALFAGCAARGYRLRLEKSGDRGGTP
jgi:hypothetical protein